MLWWWRSEEIYWMNRRLRRWLRSGSWKSSRICKRIHLRHAVLVYNICLTLTLIYLLYYCSTFAHDLMIEWCRDCLGFLFSFWVFFLICLLIEFFAVCVCYDVLFLEFKRFLLTYLVLLDEKWGKLCGCFEIGTFLFSPMYRNEQDCWVSFCLVLHTGF